MNKIEEYGLKLGGIYIEKNTEENEEIDCLIIVYCNDYWIYTVNFTFSNNQVLSNQLINNVLLKKLNQQKYLHLKQEIPSVLPFFLDGYLGQIDDELLKKVQKMKA